MSFAPRYLLVVALVIMTAHRLPAPISEIPKPTAIPKTKQTKAKSQTTGVENESRRAAKPAASFAGSWTGAAQGQGHTIFGNHASSSTYSIQVSPGEKTLSVDQKGNYYSNVRLSQIACRRQGDSLIWSYEGRALVGITGMGTLHLNVDGSAGLADERRYHSVDRLIVKITGTLMRQ
jgi:hypothetical protein